jgi:CDP-diacylglycerol---glycerol-3-phosphate 3-phosphatidyltransferase
MKKTIVVNARRVMTHIAGFLDYWTKSQLKPAHITAVSLLGHIPVALALVYSLPVLAALLLAGFSLLDALDGALARVQGTSSRQGMFFDAVSDRLKEVTVYSALAVYAFNSIESNITWQLVLVAGTSLLVSYTKAKGEMAIAGSANNKDAQKLNRLFSIGLASYESRVTAIVVGLVFGWIVYILPLLIAANAITIALRFIVISKELYLLDVEESQSKR